MTCFSDCTHKIFSEDRVSSAPLPQVHCIREDFLFAVASVGFQKRLQFEKSHSHCVLSVSATIYGEMIDEFKGRFIGQDRSAPSVCGTISVSRGQKYCERNNI